MVIETSPRWLSQMRHATNLTCEQYYRHIKLRLFFRKPEGTRPSVMSKCKCEDDIKMDIKPIVGLCALGSFGWGYGPLVCFSEDGNEIPGL